MKDVLEEQEGAFENIIGIDDGKNILKVTWNSIGRGDLQPARCKTLKDRGVRFCQV